MQLDQFFSKYHPGQHCACGMRRPKGDACMPIHDETKRPYYTVVESRSLRGVSKWAVIMVDPQQNRTYPLSQQRHPSPCRALHDAVTRSVSTGDPVLTERVQGPEDSTINWAVIEQKVLKDLYNRGVDLYINREGDASRIDWSERHPVVKMGWDAMAQSTEAHFAEEEGRLSVSEGYTWEFQTSFEDYLVPAHA